MDMTPLEQAGAVYVYTKKHRKQSSTGRIIQPQYWRPNEVAKLQPPDGFARDQFGSSLATSDEWMVVGSPGQDGLSWDAGAMYVYRLGFAAVSFVKVCKTFTIVCCVLNRVVC